MEANHTFIFDVTRGKAPPEGAAGLLSPTAPCCTPPVPARPRVRRAVARRGRAEPAADPWFALISRLETQPEEQTLPFPVPLERLQLRRMSPFSSTLNLQPSFPGRSYFELRSSAHQLSLHSSLQSLNSAGEPGASGISSWSVLLAVSKPFVSFCSVRFSPHDTRLDGRGCPRGGGDFGGAVFGDVPGCARSTTGSIHGVLEQQSHPRRGCCSWPCSEHVPPLQSPVGQGNRAPPGDISLVSFPSPGKARSGRTLHSPAPNEVGSPTAPLGAAKPGVSIPEAPALQRYPRRRCLTLLAAPMGAWLGPRTRCPRAGEGAAGAVRLRAVF